MKKTVYMLFLILLFLSGCAGQKYTTDIKETEYKMPASGEEIIESGVYGESSDLALLYDNKSYNLSIKMKNSGYEFSSVPAEDVISKIQNDEYLNNIRSQILLEYMDDSKTVSMLNSYSNSAALGQIKAYKIENGIRLVYTIGSSDTRSIVPEIITKDEFDDVLSKIKDERLKERLKSSYKLLDYQQILSNSKFEADEIAKKYSKVVTANLYELRSTTGIKNMALFETEFKAQGYTLDKLNQIYKDIGYNLQLDEGAVFVIPVDYRIENDALVAHIYMDEIKEPENASLTSITVLPQLGASQKADDGYFLVPDGSGAIINFNYADTIRYYKTKIYGPDEAVKQSEETSKTQMAYLPCYGIHDGSVGMFSVITMGDAISSLTANTASNGYPINSIHNTFALRTVDFLSYGNKSTESGTNVISKKLADSDLEQRFYFLGSNKNTYSDMAKLYREYLIGEGVLSNKKIDAVQPFVCDLIGYYTQKKTMIGIPYNKKNHIIRFKYGERIDGYTASE